MGAVGDENREAIDLLTLTGGGLVRVEVQEGRQTAKRMRLRRGSLMTTGYNASRRILTIGMSHILVPSAAAC